MNKIIPCKQTSINEVEEEVLAEFKKQFPDMEYYTTFITKWNDGTFKVEIRHGEAINTNKAETCTIHHFVWDEGAIIYQTSETPRVYGTN